MIHALQTHFGPLFDDDFLEEIARVGTFREVPAGFELIDIGETIKGVPLLLSGVVKITREDANGDELLLYYLEQGDSCSMTFSADFAHRKSKIRATAELPSSLIMVPLAKTQRWMNDYPSWRNFVFYRYQKRMEELLETLDSIAFDQLEKRLWDYLQQKARVTQTKLLPMTHFSVAQDLHSSRVVISRLLKRLEKEQKIILHRQGIELVAM